MLLTEMNRSGYRCNICDPLGRPRETYLRCAGCPLQFCDNCYYLHQDSCQSVVSQKYEECQRHAKYVEGYCFSCKIITCWECKYDNHCEHNIFSLYDAFLNIERDVNCSIDELDVRDKQIESRIELRKIGVSEHERCPQCECSVREGAINDACRNEQHFFGRLGWLKLKLAKAKKNMEYLLGERNPLLFLAKWENPNTIISLADAVLGMKQFNSVKDYNSSSKNGSEVFRNPDRSTKPNDSVEELTRRIDEKTVEILASALQGLSVKDERAEGSTSGSTNADCIIWEMLRISERLPVLVNTSYNTPVEVQRVKELLGESQHDSVNIFIGHVRKAYHCIELLHKEKKELEKELKSRTEMLANFDSDRSIEKEEYERRIQEYEKHLNKDKKEGKSFLPSFLCGIGKTKNHDDSYSPNKREETAAEQKSREDLTVLIAERESIIEMMKKEKNDLESRLSALAGEQLTKGNPALTDLGDPNRPMKIGEKYGELYDNEWTESMELIGEVKSIFPVDVKEHDDIIVHHLYRVLTECYKECKKESELQLEVFGFKTKEILEPPDENKEGENISDPHTFDEGSFHRKRKQNAESFAKFLLKEKRLCKDITESWDYRWKSESLVTKLLDTPFFQRCVYLCWSMVVQDPMMHLDDEIPKDSVYDRNLYKEFVQKGDKVKFVVWPALFLHKGGPMLYKGVVQAYSPDDSTTTDSTQKKEHFV